MNYESRDQMKRSIGGIFPPCTRAMRPLSRRLLTSKPIGTACCISRKISQSASELLAYLRLEDHVALEFEKVWNYGTSLRRRYAYQNTSVYCALYEFVYTAKRRVLGSMPSCSLFPRIPLRTFMQTNLRLNTIVANLSRFTYACSYTFCS